MNEQQLKTSCNSHRLELFLQGRLNSSETEILELHLTECESCARQIQLNAEQGVSWNEAQLLLATDEYDSPQHIAAISSLLSDEHDPMTKHQTADVLSREIRGWLDPTDDPRSMGRFAGYEIVGIVGHGGMGIVLKGFEASLNRYVAIKILAPRLATNGSARKRFAREAQAAAAVRHDNVIAIHRVDEWHSLPFLVMPYAGGISLQKRIDSDGPLSIEQTLRVGVQIASGLAAAHAQGLIHRDIKPANILLEQGVERVTITDFGLARAADDASVTRTGVIAGTPQYMSPEQAEAKQLDARSDLFSLGSVLYAMATGRPPFRGTGSFEVLKRIVNEPARPMREIESSVPEWFENIVNRLHSKSPDDRPSSASEVAALLQECLAHVQQPTTTKLPESLAAITSTVNCNRRPPIGRFIAAAAFAFSLIFAGVWMVLDQDESTQTTEWENENVDQEQASDLKGEENSHKNTIGDSVSTTTINPDAPAAGKLIDKDKLLNELRERDRRFSRRSVELERTWDTLTSPRGEASQNRFNSVRFGQDDPGMPEGLPEDYQQPHRIRYIWTGQNFESTLEILADLETAIHPEHGKLESRTIESDCFNYLRIWNRDREIFSHRSDIALLCNGEKAWEYLLPCGFGFTPSILSVSNAVEVHDGYVLKGLISLQSATIGRRRNCFELHLDKELILRKAVIQYHVYDFVIVTSGRSEFPAMPPLAKHAAASIHYIGQDEKRIGDRGNFQYEVISLSEKLSKAEYDLRINFAIPKGTKLSVGLNLVEVNLQGLPGVTQVERDEPAPRPEMTPRQPDQATGNPQPKRLQIREAIAIEDDKDFSEQSEQTTVVEFSGRRLQIDRAQPAILTEDDIVSVKFVADSNNSNSSQIVLTLTQEAGESFLIETTRLSSQPTPGYLVIEFDGTVLSAPRVNDKISNQVAISASKDDDAEKLVSAIREAMEARVPDKPQAPDQPSMSKTLQQLQGKWRLTRQIAADGDEKITPANTTWEFKGPRIVARDGGPGGVMLIELDESHSPVYVDVALEGADESGLGLLSIEDDKLSLCLGVSQKKPELRSRPEKLQWVSGVWYMELQRVKPDETIELETIEPVKPITSNATENVNQTAIAAGDMASRKTSAPTAGDAAHTISGFVMEFRSGTPDVPVCLCDAATGMPVAKDTYKPIVWSKGAAGNPANEMAIVVSDSKGNFRFENVPDGKYRLIAQKWMGPYKGVFELHGAEIRLLGAVDEITVPRPADEREARVVPTPLGENTIQFNQDVGNNETFLFLSTAPPEFDPILGLQGLGTSFWKNLIGVNRMPLGKTTVIGSPNKPVYAFMFAPDNSPGFAAITIPPPESGMVRLPAEPFVAGWSDGRKTPPPNLAELIEFMKTHELSVQQLLNIPEMSNANFKVYQARMQELTSDLSRTVDLPEGKSARVGDLLAADAYRRLQK